MYCSVAVLDGKLYAVGGLDGTSTLDVVEVYNPVTDKWTEAPKLDRKVRPTLLHSSKLGARMTYTAGFEASPDRFRVQFRGQVCGCGLTIMDCCDPVWGPSDLLSAPALTN
jgi:hypothetical protein